MMKPPSLPITLGCAVLFSSWASAQVINPETNARDPLSVTGSILTLSSGSGDILLKPEGAQNPVVPPSAWNMTNPDYSLAAIFPDHSGLVELDAISTGNAFIPPSPGGRPDLDDSWAAVSLSVSNDSVGNQNNQWITRRSNGVHGDRTSPGADIATHYLHTDAQGVLNHNLIGKSFITHLAEEQGLGGSNLPDVNGLDIAMGVIATNNALASRLLFKVVGEFYFSVSPSSAAALTGHAIHFAEDQTGPLSDVDPAAIYFCSWTFDATTNIGSWSKPQVFLTRTDLGIPADISPVVENVDAIAISPGEGAGSFVRAVFSTQRAIGRSQLRIFEEYEDQYFNTVTRVNDLVTPVNASSTQVQLVTKKFRLDDPPAQDDGDDIDAICFFDPESGSSDDVVALPVPYMVRYGNRPKGISIIRRPDGQLVIQVTGGVLAPPSSWGTHYFPEVTIEYCDDFQLGTNGSTATWIELADAVAFGTTTTFMEQWNPPSLPTDKKYFFRAVFRDVNDPVLPRVPFRQSWITALLVPGT